MKLLVARSAIAIQNMLSIAIYVYGFKIYITILKYICIISSTDPSIFMAARQQIMILTHAQKLDRMRFCFRTRVRFSDALLVSDGIILRQRMQNTLT